MKSGTTEDAEYTEREEIPGGGLLAIGALSVGTRTPFFFRVFLVFRGWEWAG
jgi:hypothetical protein